MHVIKNYIIRPRSRPIKMILEEFYSTIITVRHYDGKFSTFFTIFTVTAKRVFFAAYNFCGLDPKRNQIYPAFSKSAITKSAKNQLNIVRIINCIKILIRFPCVLLDFAGGITSDTV